MDENKIQGKTLRSKKIMFSMLFLGLLLITIGGSFAFFTYVKQGQKDNTLTTGTLTFVYDEFNDQVDNSISIVNAIPMSDAEGIAQMEKGSYFDFQIRAHTEGIPIAYEVYLTRIEEDASLDEIISTHLMEIVTDEEGNESEIPVPDMSEYYGIQYSELDDSQVPPALEENGKTLYKGKVPGNGTDYQKTFRFRMWANEDYMYGDDSVTEDGDWIYNDKTFTVKINVYAENVEPLGPGVMKEWVYNNYTMPETDFHYPIYSTTVTKISFSDKLTPPEDVIEKWDVSADEDGSVMAYLIPDPDTANVCYHVASGESTVCYNVVIAANGKVYANPNSSRAFAEFYNLKTIDFNNFDTSRATNMSYMFSDSLLYTDEETGDPNSSIIGLENFDTSHVTNMVGMFQNTYLKTLDLSHWDTSSLISVVDPMFIAADKGYYIFNSIFGEMKYLENLNLTNWDISNITNMSYMFSGCSQLSDFGFLENWDTSHVTNMAGMFYGCSQLTDLSSISNWVTTSVNDMSGMFMYCSELTSLGLSNWITSSVTNMSHMFAYCNQLSNFDFLENWDVASVTNMGAMFTGSGVETLDLSGWNTVKLSIVTSEDYIIVDDSYHYIGMFEDCAQLVSLDLSGLSVQNVTDMGRMFSGSNQLSTITGIDNWDVSKVTTMLSMFSGCWNLNDLNSISAWDTSSVTDMTGMFESCERLSTTITIRGNVTLYDSMFYDAATDENASIIVNYTSATESIVNEMLGTASEDSHIEKGVQVS